ncbi:PEP-CTERM sorting domain-containing protein [Azohydromonas aeria]|uniref:PEP-CTERM sorting domain-containing protein n=1 Tax=Azohydromonas aeria TaxID=2590212 RepID=UPI0012F73A91|nr:PEP-CTERM sorting domain-containing protein [Azohydromonas aeria]
MRYELIDLDPADGVAPSVRFTGNADARSFVRQKACNPSFHCSVDQGSFSEPAFASVEGSYGASSGFAAVSAAGLFAGGSFDTERATPGRPDNRYGSLARYRGAPQMPLFVLSARTGLRITGQYTLDAWALPWEDAPYSYRGGELARARIVFQSRHLAEPAPVLEVQAQTTWLSPPDAEHATGTVSVLLHNGLERTATVWGSFGVQATGIVPGVPEASSWALMLAGVGVVGATGRRCRRGRA